LQTSNCFANFVEVTIAHSFINLKLRRYAKQAYGEMYSPDNDNMHVLSYGKFPSPHRCQRYGKESPRQ